MIGTAACGGGDFPSGVGLGVGSSSSFFGAGLFFRFGLGVCSSSSAVVFFLADGVLVGSGVSEVLGCFFPFVFFFDDGFGFPLGVGVGEAAMVCISSRAFKKASRFFLSASLICASSKVAPSAPSTMAQTKLLRLFQLRARNKTGNCFKPVEAGPRLLSPCARRVRVLAKEWRLIFRRAAAADRSDTSRTEAQ